MNKLRALIFTAFILFLFIMATVVTSFLFLHYFGAALPAGPAVASELLLQNGALLTAVSGFLTVLLVWFYFLLQRKSLLHFGRFFSMPLRDLLPALPLGAVISIFFIALMGLLQLERFFPQHQELMASLLQDKNLLLSLLTVGVAVPLFEEIIFRGVIFNRLRGAFSLPGALILQALCFALLHLNPLQSVYAFLGALVLGLCYLWAGSLWVPVLMHVSWNSTSVIINHFLQTEPSTSAYLLVFFVSLLLMLKLLFLFRNKYYLRSRTKVDYEVS